MERGKRHPMPPLLSKAKLRRERRTRVRRIYSLLVCDVDPFVIPFNRFRVQTSLEDDCNDDRFFFESKRNLLLCRVVRLA
mmetsp:Transcript_26754/g.62853  ORF Transcript_26754/g.62853 Transcript_26754/m.62853 type:complete len:80 (-) Transcript_26754:99-338(-)